MDEQAKQSMKPLVSVVMSVYNGEQFLQRAIESILSQTYSNWEFIIIDDASNEATRKILSDYSNDGRFRIIRQPENKGLTKNLNIGVEMSKGEYIARMDADDISLPNRFEEQVLYLEQHPETVAIFSLVDLIDENGKPAGLWPDDRKATSYEAIRRFLPLRNCVAHPSVMIRKNILQQYKYNEKQLHSQDWDLWLRLVNDGKRIEKINKPLLFYRIHNNSVTKVSNKKSAFLKIHQSYKPYLQQVWKERKLNWFNFRVWLAFVLNSIKLGISKIKRSIS
jgi:glycosyltransferase involved in cell wall biosynthesis